MGKLNEHEKKLRERRKNRIITLELKKGDLEDLNTNDIDELSKGINKDIDNQMNDFSEEDDLS